MSIARSDRSRRVSLLGAVVAALAASACCVLPAILALGGLSGVSLAAALEPYRPIFLAGTGLLLGLGFYLTYRKPRLAAPAGAEAADACGCATPRVARSGRMLLWLATAFVIAFASYPYLAGALSQKSIAGPSAPVAGATTVRLQVDGMTCEACTASILREIGKVPGVIRAEVKFRDGLAIVSYDPAQVQPEQLIEAIQHAGYRARLEG